MPPPTRPAVASIKSISMCPGFAKHTASHTANGADSRDSLCQNPLMLFMVVEHFKNGDAVPVYRRFREHGRLAPSGVNYIGSWVTDDLTRCFQIMEAADRTTLDQWLARWEDLVDFDVVPVITSAEAAAAVAPRL